MVAQKKVFSFRLVPPSTQASAMFAAARCFAALGDSQSGQPNSAINGMPSRESRTRHNRSKFSRINSNSGGNCARTPANWPVSFKGHSAAANRRARSGIVRMLLRKPGRGAKDKRQGPSGFFDNFLNRQYFRDSVGRKTEFAATEPLAVIAQPGAGIEVPGIKHRHPITILKSACPHQNHAYKIGEDLVKINKNRRLPPVPGLQVPSCRFQVPISNLEFQESGIYNLK